MESRPLSESPQQLVRRLDRLYVTLATMYLRIGRALGLRRKSGVRLSSKRYARLKRRLPGYLMATGQKRRTMRKPD